MGRVRIGAAAASAHACMDQVAGMAGATAREHAAVPMARIMQEHSRHAAPGQHCCHDCRCWCLDVEDVVSNSASSRG